MKNFRHIYCITFLSLAFGFCYGQLALVDNSINTGEKANITALQSDAMAFHTSDPVPDNNEPDVTAKPEIKIYPEPFEGIISVNLKKCPDAQICLFDAKGNCLKYQNCENEECAIFNLRNEPKGIYYMEIKVKGEKTVKAIYLQQKF